MSTASSDPAPVPNPTESNQAPQTPDGLVDASVDAPDVTLQGYTDHHDRPPAFEGVDGHPYTVSIEVEKTPDLAAPYVGYLIFPRWALTGVGIVGHVESGTVLRAKSSDAARAGVGELPLHEVKALLDRAVADSREHDRSRFPDSETLESETPESETPESETP